MRIYQSLFLSSAAAQPSTSSSAGVDGERQPLLPTHAASAASTTAANISSGMRRDRPQGNLQALITQYEKRTIFNDDGVNTKLLGRTAGKFAKGVGKLVVQSLEAVATTAATAFLTRAVLGRLSANDDKALDQAFIDTLAVATSSIVARHARNEDLSKQDMVMLALIAMATQYQSQTGLQLAMANQMSASLGPLFKGVMGLIRNALPTRRDDFQLVFEELKTRSKEFQKAHPELEESFSILDSSIANRLLYIDDKDHRGFTELRNLFKARFLLSNPPEARDVPNLFHNERNGVEAQAVRYNRIQHDLVNQVPRESQGAVEAFIRRLRSATRPDWQPGARRAGSSDMNVILFVGKPGTGKTYMANRIVEQFGLKAVRMSLPQFVARLSDQTALSGQSSSQETLSPEKQLGPVFELMEKGLADALIMEEVDLADVKQADVIKAMFDPARFGEFEIKGYPEGVTYKLDLRRTPIILTSNILPNDSAIARRFPKAVFDRVSGEIRRQAAENAFAANVDELRSLRLTDEQRRSVEARMAGLLDFIIDASEADPGPANLGAVIGEAFSYATKPFLSALAVQTEEGPPTMQASSSAARHPEEPGASETDRSIRKYIHECFEQRRVYDAVQHAVDEAIDRHAEHRLAFSDLEAIAKQRELGPRDTIEFLRKAVEGMWEEAVPQKSQEVQTSLGELLKSVDYSKNFIKPSDEPTDVFFNCRRHLAVYHLLMELPTESINLSHWEIGADRERRKEMEAIKSRIVADTPGEENKRSVAEFIQRVCDNTLPGSIEKKRAVMTLWGPPGTGKTYLAEHIFNELGLRCIKMSMTKLMELMGGDFFIGDSNEMTHQKLLGHLYEFFNGDRYGAGILVDEAYLDPVKIDMFKRFFDPNNMNVKLTYDYLPTVKITLPIGEIPIIMTSNYETTDDALLRRITHVHIDKTDPAIRIKVAKATYERQVALLSNFDLSSDSKAAITQAAANAMDYIVENNSDNDAGPALLEIVIASLFGHLRAQYMKSDLNIEPSRADDISLETPWATRASATDLPDDLKELVDEFFSTYRPKEGSTAS